MSSNLTMFFKCPLAGLMQRFVDLSVALPSMDSTFSVVELQIKNLPWQNRSITNIFSLRTETQNAKLSNYFFKENSETKVLHYLNQILNHLPKTAFVFERKNECFHFGEFNKKVKKKAI